MLGGLRDGALLADNGHDSDAGVALAAGGRWDEGRKDLMDAASSGHADCVAALLDYFDQSVGEKLHGEFVGDVRRLSAQCKGSVLGAQTARAGEAMEAFVEEFDINEAIPKQGPRLGRFSL